jgi:protein TonB
MSSYRGSADRSGRVKAIAAALAVNAALAAVILTGLNVTLVSRAVEHLTTLDIHQLRPPPPEPPPPPQRKPRRAKLEEGAAGKKVEPSPIVAPKPRIPVQSPVPAAPVAGTGSATTSGAATSGTGTGAGGSGRGPGGGGDGFTAARRISKIPDREYWRLASTGLQSGRVGITVKVNTDGRVSNCRVARSSGDGSIDALMCQLTLRYVRFEPARDPSDRPVAQDVTFFPNWWRP